jgi:hypothetical protein
MNPEREVRLIPVRVFTGGTARLDAELAKALLAEQGIESVIPGEVAADTFPFLDVQLFVREEDLELAAEILASTLASGAAGIQSDDPEDSEGE